MTQAIFIPSRERAELLAGRKRHTLTYTQHGEYPVYLVVRQSEEKGYRELAKKFNAQLIAAPEHADTIAKTYDWITNNFANLKKGLFMDDDLIFAKRTSFESSGLKSVAPEQFHEIEEELFNLVTGKVALSGLAHRRGAQNITNKYIKNTKIIAVMCCNLEVLRSEHLKWDWGFKSMFDHNMNLELLTKGYENVLCGMFTHDDIFARFKHGGCSAYRGVREHSHAAMALAAKFPEAVTVREKFYEAQRVFGNDVTLRMKKAFRGDKNV